MGQLPFWHSVELSAGERPILREKEMDVHVEDQIGLYQGKSKIMNRQNGRVYLTSQRLIYIDNLDTAKYSCAIELDDVKDVDYSTKFLRSSPKITIFFKQFKKKQLLTDNNPAIKINWECQICSSANEVALNYKPQDQLSCDTCGMKPEPGFIQSLIASNKKSTTTTSVAPGSKREKIACPACTFLNHPSLRLCEICGSNLPINDTNLKAFENQEIFDDRIKIETDSEDGLDEMVTPLIKLSFHKDGDKIFLKKLLETIEKFEWEKLVENGNINKEVVKINDRPIAKNIDEDLMNHIGIHGLAKQGDLQTQRNEQVINSSLDDLQTLLEKANEILTMIDSFKQLQDTSDESSEKTIYNLKQEVLRDSAKEKQFGLYLKEVSRKISDFLINEGTLQQEGGVITLVDLFALYNRGRIGQNLISPNELFEACSLFESLRLPLLLKRINDIYVVQDLKFANNEQIIKDIISFINEFGDDDDYAFKYSNVLKISDFFNWSLTITEEFLQIAIESGNLLIDEQIFGKHYYLNLLLNPDVKPVSSDKLDYYKPHEEVPPLPIQSHDTAEAPQSVLEEAPSTNTTLDFTFPTIPYRQPITPSPTQKVSKTLLDLQGLNI